MLRGLTLNKNNRVGAVTVNWIQGGVLGLGGQRSLSYDLYNYSNPSGALCPVYIQSGWEAPQVLTLDDRVQFGCNKGIIFLVLHDKENTPYQHRFITKGMQENLYTANAALKQWTGGWVDLSWVKGDYLRNV